MSSHRPNLLLTLGCLLILGILVTGCSILARPTPPPPPTPTVAPIYPIMVLVEPGSFSMGSDNDHLSESPAHQVTLTRAYEIGSHAVTYAEYDRYCQSEQIARVNPDVTDRRLPVSHVDWYDAVAYCNWLSERAGLPPCYSGGGRVTICDYDANGYRLPTEAEWENAAGGGGQGQDTLYAGGDDPDRVGWHRGNSGGQSHPVGELEPNELGLYDMSGNRWEWCGDWYDADYYAASRAMDPRGPDTPPKGGWVERARRSGSALETTDAMRITYRSADYVNYPGDNGFRLVRTVP